MTDSALTARLPAPGSGFGHALREHWSLDPAIHFLNHGSYGAAPHHVLAAQSHWRAALVDSGVPGEVADDLLWLTLSIVRGLAIRRLWQHDAPRFNRLFRLWREMVAQHLAALASAKPRATRGR